MQIIGSVGPVDLDFGEAQIRRILSSPKALVHSSEFTGRPTTKLFIDDGWVVKLRKDFVFQPKDASKKALAALSQERELSVYHPQKTWFIWQEASEELVIGNITPHLNPFHLHLNQILAGSLERFQETIAKLLRLYFITAKEKELRLDEGLSNFGFDENGAVYYLDDDVYPWDDYTSFTSMLGVWIRQNEQFSEVQSHVFADVLIDSLATVFGSRHQIQILLGQLRNVLSVSNREQSCIQIIKDRLYQSAQRTSIPRVAYEEVEPARPDEPVVEHILDPVADTGITETRFAVIADVHANLPALDAVLDSIEQAGIQQILVLGDVVGYGPHPAQCIERLRERSCVVVQGNHDYAASSGDVSRGFSKLATWAIHWTRENISNEDKLWLEGLPPVIHQDNWMAVHGSPIDKQYFYGYVYHMTYVENLQWLAERDIRFAFHGHSHIQSTYTRMKKMDSLLKGESHLNLSDVTSALVCPGSVGQPRGGSKSAEYCIFDSGTSSVDNIQVDYDVTSVCREMRERNFPSALYDRLEQGK